jgi:hypothetical protein
LTLFLDALPLLELRFIERLKITSRKLIKLE